MVKVICEKYTATVEAKGFNRDLYLESLGLILEGFKLIRKLDSDLYEKAKLDIFGAIVDGRLDVTTAPNDTTDGHEYRFDIDALREQLKNEEGDI